MLCSCPVLGRLLALLFFFFFFFFLPRERGEDRQTDKQTETGRDRECSGLFYTTIKILGSCLLLQSDLPNMYIYIYIKEREKRQNVTAQGLGFSVAYDYSMSLLMYMPVICKTAVTP